MKQDNEVNRQYLYQSANGALVAITITSGEITFINAWTKSAFMVWMGNRAETAAPITPTKPGYYKVVYDGPQKGAKVIDKTSIVYTDGIALPEIRQALGECGIAINQTEGSKNIFIDFFGTLDGDGQQRDFAWLPFGEVSITEAVIGILDSRTAVITNPISVECVERIEAEATARMKDELGYPKRTFTFEQEVTNYRQTFKLLKEGQDGGTYVLGTTQKDKS